MGLMKISVFGLGYVGTITAACLAQKGMQVVGVDVSQQKVDAINQGRSPVVEPSVLDLIERGAKQGLISASTDPYSSVASTDVSIICVGTPSQPNGEIDLRFVEEVVGQIASSIRSKNSQHTICLRSTSIPGTTRRLFKEHFSAPELAEKVELLFVPEFLREGTAVADFLDPSTYVIGTADRSSPRREAILSLFSDKPCTLVNWEEAETVKYAFNAFHALKVVFANEMGRIGKSLSLDSRLIMRILSEDTVLNISPYYLRPGNPYGGSCLPKDVAALMRLANRNSVEAPVIGALESSNRIHQDLLRQLVLETGCKKVCILGLSFKANTDDLRNSPMVSLAEFLLGKGFDLTIVDPQLRPQELVGRNRSVAAAALPHLDRLIRTDVQEAVADCQLIVAAQKCADWSILCKSVTKDHYIIDVNGWPQLEELPAKYQGLCWG
jgi:GDP-mannose 6-dehydrogenase